MSKNRKFKLGHRNKETELKTNTYTSHALNFYHASRTKTWKYLKEPDIIILEHSESILILVIQDCIIIIPSKMLLVRTKYYNEWTAILRSYKESVYQTILQ
jgi:hypothetical protein